MPKPGPFDEEVLFLFRNGPASWKDHPELYRGPDCLGIRERIGRFLRKVDKKPILYVRLWQEYRHRFLKLPGIEDWAAWRSFESIDDETLDAILASE